MVYRYDAHQELLSGQHKLLHGQERQGFNLLETTDHQPASATACVALLVQDAPLDSNPTCGWYYRAGVKVPDSQGFTCQCDTALIWDTTFGGTKQRT